MSYIFIAAPQIFDKKMFCFFLRNKIRPHISLDTEEASSLWSDGPYVLFMSSEHLLVWMSKIIRLPQDFCPTGCKWTLESRLQTTCQGSPPPEESFNTSGEVSWETDVLERLINVSSGHMLGVFSPLETNKNNLIWVNDSVKTVLDYKLRLLLTAFGFFFLFDSAVHSGSWSTSSLSHFRLVPTGGKEFDR